jgi:hypothetical protein
MLTCNKSRQTRQVTGEASFQKEEERIRSDPRAGRLCRDEKQPQKTTQAEGLNTLSGTNNHVRPYNISAMALQEPQQRRAFQPSLGVRGGCWAAFSRNRRTLNPLHKRAKTIVSRPQLFCTRHPRHLTLSRKRSSSTQTSQRGSML